MASLSNYQSHYATWNRTRRLQVPPYVATENNVTTPPRTNNDNLFAARTTPFGIPETVGPTQRVPVPPKKPDTLFGPGVGVVASGPDWTEPKVAHKDELTPDVVKTWMSKSKENAQPTTTLQALVNLKRPSIKLSPLVHPDDAHDANHQQHALEFEFDCDAPKCSIQMHALNPVDSAQLLVFESIVDGGFGKTLKYDDGAVLELDSLDFKSISEPVEVSEAPSTTELTAPTSNLANGLSPRHRRRFSHFPFRRRSDNGERVAGPALAVVDADAPQPTFPDPSSPHALEPKIKDEGGVKAMIKLEALDEDQKHFVNRNSQITYLHIVRLGAPPASGEEDRRPWIVKVVRREATIGSHTFHLHEIYGLSSATAPAPAPPLQHAYPPPGQIVDDQTSECLLCLSSPREVVLLPCRHLVACKECAINMVEFGAGGSLVHSEAEPAADGSSPAVAAPTAGEETAVPPVAGEQSAPVPAPVQPPQRRKRKAKGWFCPVCRQPYTSLIRITTIPPEKELPRSSSSHEDLPSTDATRTGATNAAPTAATPAVTETRSIFGRPSFFRSLSRPNSRPTTAGNMA